MPICGCTFADCMTPHWSTVAGQNWPELLDDNRDEATHLVVIERAM
jgi:hypothetical protein